MYRNYARSFAPSSFSPMQARFPSTCPRCRQPIEVDAYITRPASSKYYVHVSCPVTRQSMTTPRPTLTTSYVPLAESDMGAYVACHDSSLVYCVRSAPGDNGTYYFAQRWDTDRFYTKDPAGDGWTGRVCRWIRAGKLRKMSQDEASEFVGRTGWCPVHGGTLTNKDSVDAGVGPICAERMGWDRMGMAKANRAARAEKVKTEKAQIVAARTPEQTEARYAELFGDEPSNNRTTAPTIEPAPEIPMGLLMGNGDSAHLNDRNPRTGAGSRERRAAVRSLWTRANSDDLGAAAGYGSDEDY